MYTYYLVLDTNYVVITSTITYDAAQEAARTQAQADGKTYVVAETQWEVSGHYPTYCTTEFNYEHF